MAVRQGAYTVFLLLAVTLTAGNPVSITVQDETFAEVTDYRLPSTVVPTRYQLEVTLDENSFKPENPQFTGFVEIEIVPTAQVATHLILNSKSITFGSVDPILYDKADADKINLLKDPKNSNNIDDALERITFELKEALTQKPYILQIDYIGKLHDDMYGFYLSSYLEDGKTQYLATTQFQPTHARRAFPCFDEPHFKATFDITIIHPKEYHALSNTQGTKTAVAGQPEIRETKFSTTPKMSTYLVAMIVSQFSSMSTEDDIVNIKNKVLSQPQLIPAAHYSLHIAPKILTAMQEFTGVSYDSSGLTKLEQVAIPDFSAGAMENWGLVTYRESAMLWDRAESTAQTKQRVATIVAHELAHMWFGNLITTKWWSTTWLNEGFARYYQYYAADQVETTWELKNQFVVEQQQSILISDALSSTGPLTSQDDDVLTPSDIRSKFDSITYNKGASVIRMMEHFMGETNFEARIKEYLKIKATKDNVEPNDLWNAMNLEDGNNILPAGKSIKDVMDRWTEQPGFPVVTVGIKEGTDNQVVLKAERFFFNKPEAASTDSVWYIPITYSTKSKNADFKNTQATKEQWLALKEELPISFNAAEDSWIILNVQSSAYYRVNYDATLWKAIEEALKEKHDDIHVLNRAQIADDALNLARGGYIEYSEALDVVEYLEKEIEYYPWYSAFNAFAYLRRRIDSESDLGKYLRAYISNLMQSLYESASFDTTPENQVGILKKVLTLTWACELNNEECVAKAQELFDLLKKNSIPVQADLRSVVYSTAIRNSEDNDNWDFLWERLKATNLASEITLIITALGSSRDEETLKSYLAETIKAEPVIRPQDAHSVFTAVISGSSVGIKVGLEFLTTNYKAIDEKYSGSDSLAKAITSIADRLTTEDQINAFKDFADTADLDAATKTAATDAIAKCDENLNWVDSFQSDLLKYLQEKVGGTTTTTDTTTTTITTTTPKPGGGGDGATSITASSAVFLLSVLAILNMW